MRISDWSSDVCSSDLFIRQTHGEHFTLEVAGYPEMHPQATNPQIDFDAYVRKVKAGAHGVVTQYFYNADAYFDRSEEHTSELQSLMRISYAVFCLKKKKKQLHNLDVIVTNHSTHTHTHC